MKIRRTLEPDAVLVSLIKLKVELFMEEMENEEVDNYSKSIEDLKDIVERSVAYWVSGFTLPTAPDRLFSVKVEETE